MTAIEPFTIAFPDADLVDLRDRLARTRWPEREPVRDWSQGVPLAAIDALCAYWREAYDWRRCEAMLNGWNPARTVIDDLGIAFFHIRSPEPDALPVVMTHGWPGSPIEFGKVVGPLTDPLAQGGRAEDALHLVLPCLPGYGLSDKPTGPDWDIARTAEAWTELMQRLGYGDRWGAQGGDWGGAVTLALAARKPVGLVGCHFNIAIVAPTHDEAAAADEAECAMIERRKRYDDDESGYAKQQSTRPQTVGYALADSPAGQAAWIYEKFNDWTDNKGVRKASCRATTCSTTSHSTG